MKDLQVTQNQQHQNDEPQFTNSVGENSQLRTASPPSDGMGGNPGLSQQLNDSPKVRQLKKTQKQVNGSPQVMQQKSLHSKLNGDQQLNQRQSPTLQLKEDPKLSNSPIQRRGGQGQQQGDD